MFQEAIAYFYTSNSSGGEPQMLSIAPVLTMRLKLLVLGEPRPGLAPVIRKHLSKALEALRNSSPIAVLIREQKVTIAQYQADRMHMLEHARFAWQGTPGRFEVEEGAAYP